LPARQQRAIPPPAPSDAERRGMVGATVEARSALARLLREGKLSAKGMQQAIARLEARPAAWLEILPSENIRLLAESNSGSKRI